MRRTSDSGGARRPTPRRAWVPYFVLATALVLTAVATYYAWEATEAEDRGRFNAAVTDTRDSIRDRLDTYVALLRAGAGLFAASPGGEVSREQFRAFVEGQQVRRLYPGVQAIGFSARVAAEGKAAFEERERREGFTDFSVHPGGERDEYHAILYLEPLEDERNRRALGFDMSSEPVRRAAMERARDSGLPVASGRVTLIQETDAENKQAGFLIYFPVYRRGLPATTTGERRAALAGFVYSPFRADDLLRGVFVEGPPVGLAFRVFDGEQAADENLLHSSHNWPREAERARFTQTARLVVEGRMWTLAFATTPEFESAARGWLPIVPAGGILVSLVLFFVARSQARARAAAETAASSLQVSETRFRTVIEQSPLSTQVFTPDGHTIMVNRAWEKLWGATLEKLGGYNILEDHQLVEKGIMPFIRKGFEGEAAQVPAILYDPEETVPGVTSNSEPRRWVQAVIYPVKDERGRVREVVLVHEDITERRRAEAALGEAERRALTQYEALLGRLVPLAQAFGTARDLRTIYKALLDFSLLSMPCMGFFIALYDEKLDARIAAYAWGEGVEVDVSRLPPMPVTDGPNSRAVRTGQIVFTPDYAAATKGHPSVPVGVDNGRMPRSSMSAPMSYMGRIVGTVEVQSYDLAAFGDEHATALGMAANLAAVAIENLRLFELERRARSEAEEANRLKDEFLATLSHELRTPLTAILGWSRLMSTEEALDARTFARAVESIERNARAQTQLIDDLLDVSRIITGKLRVEVRPVELSSVIESAAESARPAAEAKNLSLRVLADPSAGPVLGDPDRLQQVVWNLLSNAIKFTPPGGSVEVRLGRSSDAHAEIAIRDTGAGIAPEFLPHVFDRFRQADGAITRRHGGLGLGLSIVRNLVELHGGTVTAESEGAGAGSTFRIRLPLLAARGASASPGDGATAGGRESADDSAALDGRRVLVVDDDRDTRELLATLLRACGAEVVLAASAAEALEHFGPEGAPEVLVSDIGMPDEDGYELIRKVRALPADLGGRTPAVALTAYARAEDRRQAFDAGYDAHLPKPVEPSELTRVVVRLAARGVRA